MIDRICLRHFEILTGEEEKLYCAFPGHSHEATVWGVVDLDSGEVLHVADLNGPRRSRTTAKDLLEELKEAYVEKVRLKAVQKSHGIHLPATKDQLTARLASIVQAEQRQKSLEE